MLWTSGANWSLHWNQKVVKTECWAPLLDYLVLWVWRGPNEIQ